jgi:hypothetical protein
MNENENENKRIVPLEKIQDINILKDSVKDFKKENLNHLEKLEEIDE